MTSTRGLARRFTRHLNRGKEIIARVGLVESDLSITVAVPDTTNSIYVRLFGDRNRTHPAINQTGIVFVASDRVLVQFVSQAHESHYEIVRPYTVVP